MTKQQTIELLQQQLPSFYSVEQVINIINGIDEKEHQVEMYNEDQIKEMAEQIANEIESEGLDLINDYDLSLNYKEVELDSIDFNKQQIASLIEEGISAWLEENK